MHKNLDKKTHIGLFLYVFLMMLPAIQLSFAENKNPYREKSESRANPEVLLERAKTLINNCIKKTVGTIKDPQRTPPHPDKGIFNSWTPTVSMYTEIAIFEFLLEHFEEFQTNDEKKFCRDKLFPAYLKGYKEAFLQQTKESSGTLAPLGTGEIDADSFIIELAHNHYGDHYLGHSDITRKALQALNKSQDGNLGLALRNKGDGKISQASINLIAMASQLPDLYKWTDESYHAHSLENSDGIQDDGVQEFLTLIAKQIRAFRQEARQDGFQAAFRLGTTLHMIQDLVYHHGMTLSQHSGLAYISSQHFQNPDFPDGTISASNGGVTPGSAAAKRLEMAKSFSIRLIIAAIEPLPKNIVRRIFQIPKATSKTEKKKRKISLQNSIVYSFCNIREESVVFQCEQEISLWELMKYYLLHWKFSDPYTELIAVHNPSVPWNPEQILNQAINKINGAL